ncbi:tripartite tricarboxylate transporter TctB family protein [Telmatospirillum sp. J64-1]|uniref:tripartite tricarboxylate transporter TctB family protein n=1 Tax=Telmatospirillum sp. J64-1 TaxID=2502183 RepID=UPI00163D5608|nr:tripartite tricarboxylate transporter TctB family protein [Telmatospirillum sp. J64-1]
MANPSKRLAFNLPDLLGGLAIIAIGLYVIWEASGYSIGSLRRMGAGFFPLVLGVLACALGLAILLFEGRRPRASSAGLPLKGLVAVSAGVLGFALTVDRLGVVPATFLLVLLSSLAETTFRPVSALLTAAVLSAIAVLVFLMGLGMPLQAFWWR